MRAVEDTARRFKELDELGRQVNATIRRGEITGAWVDAEMCVRWHTSALDLVERVYGRNSAYYERIAQAVGNIATGDERSFRPSWAAFQAAKEDFESGYARRFEDIVAGEVFDDFVEMAGYLLSQGYHVPAASLAGAVLEDALRRLCAKEGLKWAPPSSIKKLNDILRGARVLSPAECREVQSWEDVRNDVDHGLNVFADAERVRSMLEGVNQFLARHLP